MNKIKDLDLEKFIEELASPMPAPGGGAVAALCSSISASLSSMVFNLTIDKKFYNEYNDQIKSKISSARNFCQNKKDEFLVMMDEDAEVFNEVMSAYKLPKETEVEKQVRNNKIQNAYIAAMEIPLKVANKTYEIFDTLKLAAEYGNPHTVSDAGIGALLAFTSIEAALLNVKINLVAIKDIEITTRISTEANSLYNRSLENKKDIMEIVNNKIG